MDKLFAAVAGEPIVHPVIRYHHDLDFSIFTFTWFLEVVVIVSTMFFGNTAVRATRNSRLWLLVCIATYWFLMIGFVE